MRDDPDERLNTPLVKLMDAIVDRDIEAVRELAPQVKNGETSIVGFALATADNDINGGDKPLGASAHKEIMASTKEIVRILAENGHDLNQPYGGRSPLSLAAMIGEPELAGYLIERGAPDVPAALEEARESRRNMINASPEHLAALDSVIDILEHPEKLHEAADTWAKLFKGGDDPPLGFDEGFDRER